ncbi:MAG TPA: ImpA family metalloprotease, partial [Polyangiaceae bacterium]|nr:ImpA family metalloprotease [Polyangiaceae bacterium]
GQRTAFDADLIALFRLNEDGASSESSLDSIDWDPSHDAVLMRPTLGKNTALLVENAVVSGDATLSGRALAIYGRRGKTPYLVMGSNPFRTEGNEQMDQLMVNAIRRLTGSQSGDALRITMAQVDESYWFPDETTTRAWLQDRMDGETTINAADACDSAKLDGCIDAGTDLLIVSQISTADESSEKIVASVRRAMEKGVPVLYLQHDGGMTELGTALFELLDVAFLSDNYWVKAQLAAFDSTTTLGYLNDSQLALRELLEHIDTGSYDFSLPLAQTDQKDLYESQFLDGAEFVRSMMNGYDAAARDIFQGCDNEFPKLLALLGDQIRGEIRYPMRTDTTGTARFLEALYADHAVYNTRRFVPAQTDRGSFDSRKLERIEGNDVKVSLTSRPWFRSTGVYALPGKPLTVTRTDGTEATTRIFVNTQRSGSTKVWEDDSYGGYSRPLYLRSQAVPLAPGESVTITSAYGGPVQIEFEQVGAKVEFEFENVGQHPHWSSSADNDSFAKSIASDVYDWVEVATPAFELHSTAKKFAETMGDARWNTPATLAEAIEIYTFDNVHVLAGFRGDGITSVPEIVDWAATTGIEIPVLDEVKHGNMDQPTCGDGCSGNPYDAGWSFSPIGHGDLHELGHSLQNGRFQLTHQTYQYANHSVTNWSPFYAANAYFDDHGGETSDWSIEHDAIFGQLQAAYVAGERAGSFSTHMDDYFSGILSAGGDSGIKDNYAFFMQAMLMAKSHGKLENGYHIVPRIHLLDRAYRSATANQEAWDAAKTGLGFASYTLEQAGDIGNNDFMLVAMSFVTGLDYRDFFDMWGLATSTQAKDQVAGFSLPVVERAFFALGPLGHNHGAMSTQHAEFQKITLDGTTAWPLP